MAIELNGVTYRSLAEVARANGLNRETLYKRIKRGWTLERAVEEETMRGEAWDTCQHPGCKQARYYQSKSYCYFHWKQSQKLIPKGDRENYLSESEKSVVESFDHPLEILEIRDRYLGKFLPFIRKMSTRMGKKYSIDREELYQEGCVSIIVCSTLIDSSRNRAEKTNFIKNAIFWKMRDHIAAFYNPSRTEVRTFFEEGYSDEDLPDDLVEFVDNMDPEQLLIDKEEMKRRMSDEELGMALMEEYRNGLPYRDMVIWDLILEGGNYGCNSELACKLDITDRNLRYIKQKLVLKFSKFVRENTHEI